MPKCKNCNQKVTRADLEFVESNGYFPAGIHGADCGCVEENDDMGLHCACEFEKSLSKTQAPLEAESANNNFTIHKSSSKVCPKCNGTGAINIIEDEECDVCPKCKGSGKPS